MRGKRLRESLYFEKLLRPAGGAGGVYGEPKWMYREAADEKISLAGDWIAKLSAAKEKLGPKPAAVGFNGDKNNPTALYNGMVDPLIPISFKGVIWYQGESNDRRGYQYRSLFPLLIKDWRAKWSMERRKYNQKTSPKAAEDDFPCLLGSTAKLYGDRRSTGRSRCKQRPPKE